MQCVWIEHDGWLHAAMRNGEWRTAFARLIVYTEYEIKTCSALASCIIQLAMQISRYLRKYKVETL